jgi:RNase P subunit RPR2
MMQTILWIVAIWLLMDVLFVAVMTWLPSLARPRKPEKTPARRVSRQKLSLQVDQSGQLTRRDDYLVEQELVYCCHRCLAISSTGIMTDARAVRQCHVQPILLTCTGCGTEERAALQDMMLNSSPRLTSGEHPSDIPGSYSRA